MNEDIPLKFPTDAEIQVMLQAMEATMGEIVGLAGDAGIDYEGLLRFFPMAHCLQAAREHHGLSIREAARRLGAKQKSLKAIEIGTVGDSDGVLLEQYAGLLGCAEVLRHWGAANAAMALRLGLNSSLAAAPAERGGEPGQEKPPDNIIPFQLAGGGERPQLVLPPDFFSDGFLTRTLPTPPPGFAAEILAAAPELLALGGEPDPVALEEPAPPAVYQFKITLDGIQPAVWRRFQVPNDLTLDRFHEVLQAVMGWTDSHLHELVIRGLRFTSPTGDYAEIGPIADEQEYPLAFFHLAARERLEYHYDFGDDWRHRVVLEKILPADPEAKVLCLKGAGACPPEDCGGPWRYAEMLQALRLHNHPEHEEWREWVSPDFDPAAFDVAEVNRQLAKLLSGWRRRRSRKKKPPAT